MSDMKCPFCQQKMIRTNGTHNKVGVWQCQNYNDPDNVCIASGYLFNEDVLNYIDRTRKALEIARHTIGWINQMIDEHVDKQAIKTKCKYALNEIIPLEQKEIK